MHRTKLMTYLSDQTNYIPTASLPIQSRSYSNKPLHNTNQSIAIVAMVLRTNGSYYWKTNRSIPGPIPQSRGLWTNSIFFASITETITCPTTSVRNTSIEVLGLQCYDILVVPNSKTERLVE